MNANSIIFKIHGNEFKPAKLNARQAAAGIIYAVFGIRTTTYNATMKARRESWKAHAAKIQNELNEQRAKRILNDERSRILGYDI